MHAKGELPALRRGLVTICALGLAACQSATATPGPLTAQATLKFDPALAEQTAHRLDVDSGQVVGDATGDIELQVSDGTAVFNVLLPVAAAQAKFMGAGEPTEADCRQSLPEMSAHNIPEVAAGSYICLVSGQGRLARLSITQVDQVADGSLAVTFEVTTWPPQD